MRKWVVRVTIPEPEAFDPNETLCQKLLVQSCNTEVASLVEALRYAQLIRTHDCESGLCFDLICPHGLDSKSWSEQNAARMRSMGYQAIERII